jgi:hypothetical protein
MLSVGTPRPRTVIINWIGSRTQDPLASRRGGQENYRGETSPSELHAERLSGVRHPDRTHDGGEPGDTPGRLKTGVARVATFRSRVVESQRGRIASRYLPSRAEPPLNSQRSHVQIARD